MNDKKNLKELYKTMADDPFPSAMEISFIEGNKKQTLYYEKATWNIDGETKGLRYGENPDQPAALYKLVNGNLVLGQLTMIQPGKYLASDIELLQSGKHPGKINITDVDSALNILKYFPDKTCCVIVKHNNPCGVALGSTAAEAYHKAYFADRVAAFGGAIAINTTMDKETAELITQSYSEVVVAPDFTEDALALLKSKKNLRIMRIENMNRLIEFRAERFIEPKALIDGGLIMQWSFSSAVMSKDDFLPAETEYKGQKYAIKRKPTEKELDDMLFGWLVETGVTSNSVIYVKDGVTVGIGTGEQDRVGVAMIARDKAYTKMADRLCWERYKKPWNMFDDEKKKQEIWEEVEANKGGIKGSIMVSDAFFPFRDGVDVGIREGVTGVVQPGGSLRDFESIEACNEAGVTMVFTGQRCFRH